MSSIARPSSGQRLRRLIVLAAALFSVAIGQSQVLMGWGQSPGEFAADSDETLRVASYAFSIWGLIYLWLLAYAVRQVLPQTRENALIHGLGWPSVGALLGIGAWVVAAAFDWEGATVVLIFGSLLVLLLPMLARAGDIRALDRRDRDRWFVIWPLAMLTGWLTVAAPVNLLTVVTGNGDLPDIVSPTVWAIMAVVVVAVVGLGVTARIRTLAYGLPIAWGLAAVYVAEQVRNSPLAWTALGGAATVLVGAALLVFRPGARVR
ncbi:MAG: hypothetical protein ACK4VY_03585 [Brevundimonas sp.]